MRQGFHLLVFPIMGRKKHLIELKCKNIIVPKYQYLDSKIIHNLVPNSHFSHQLSNIFYRINLWHKILLLLLSINWQNLCHL
jgi:hypothetical protein